MFATVKSDEAVFNLFMLVMMLLIGRYLLKRRGTNSTAHGSAFWMTDVLLKKWRMLVGGLIIGRTLSGKLLYVEDYVHVMIIGGTGSGKSAGFVACNLIKYPGAVISFDPKGELAAICPGITIASDNSGHGLNPLDPLPPGDVDRCRQLAEGIIDSSEQATDSHWNAKSVSIVTGVLCKVTKNSPPEERNLLEVLKILSNVDELRNTAIALNGMGGVYVNFAGEIAQLFKEGSLTREGSSVISTATRHLSWANGIAGASATKTTFDINTIRDSGSRIYLKVPMEFIEAHKGWLRVMTTALLQAAYKTKGGEILYMCDEAWLLSGLGIIERMLLIGRSSGVRLALAFQSMSQVRSAFKGKESLIPDNCRTHIILEVGRDDATSLKTSLGKATLEIITQSTNHGATSSPTAQGSSYNRGESANASLLGRDLMTEDELIHMPDDCQIVLHKGLPAPIFCRKVRWFDDPAFGGKRNRNRLPWRKRISFTWRLLIALAIIAGVVVAQQAIKDAQYQKVKTWQKAK